MTDKVVANDPFQMAWLDLEAAHALYVDDEHGLMVLPDAQPVVEHHILVITHEATPFEELSTSRKHQVLELANITAEYMRKVLKPERKVGLCIWGNTIKTTHVHLLPRRVPEDGAALFVGERAWASDKQLEETRKLLTFPAKLKIEIRQHLNDIARSFPANS